MSLLKTFSPVTPTELHGDMADKLSGNYAYD
jgi:hypothetical protein